jgi:hypothetical protein
MERDRGRKKTGRKKKRKANRDRKREKERRMERETERLGLDHHRLVYPSTGDIFKLAVLQGLLFVSFWDEFGVSVGATALPDLLAPNKWSHLVISREFETGRIKVRYTIINHTVLLMHVSANVWHIFLICK